MYRLEVKCSGKWRWGVRMYETLADAEKRIKELARIGIKARIKEAGAFYK